MAAPPASTKTRRRCRLYSWAGLRRSDEAVSAAKGVYLPNLLVPIVGRDAEIGALALALDAAAEGTAGVVALVGEPGSGKSRLAEEITALARTQGYLTLHAAASPLHADLHYGVIVEALRPVVRTVEAGARTRLVEGLPDLGRLFDGLGLPGPVSLGDPSMERTRLFEAVFQLLDRLTRQQPVLLVVDDMHWADPASIAMLHYVVRGLVDRRFLLLIMLRSGESSEALNVLLQSLRQSDVLSELSIGSLDAAGVRALACGLLADDPPSTLTSLLVQRARGLPLFVRAMVTMLVDSSRLYRSGGRWVLGPEPVDDIPPELIGVLRSRLDALEPIDRGLFDTMAVAGGVVGHDLISALLPDEEELLSCVKRLRNMGLLVEEFGEAGVRYQVTHPLLAEVAHDDLPAISRRRMHAAFVSALRQLDQVDLGRLAHHVRGAGDEVDPTTALEVIVAALVAALEAKAGEQAVRHADAAIGLLRRTDGQDLLPRLLEQRAEALELAGRGDAAIVAWRAAAEHSTTLGRLVDAARQLRRLAIVEWDTGHPLDSRAHLDEATALLAGTQIGQMHLALAETRMRMLARQGLLSELGSEIAELEDIAVATGSPQAVAFAHWGRTDLCLNVGDYRGAQRASAAMMRLAGEQQSVIMLEEAHRPAVCIALAWGDLPAARQLAREGRRLAVDSDVPSLQVIITAVLAFTDFLAGAWTEATAEADDALALSHRVGMRRGAAASLCVRALVQTRRGQFTESLACLRDARSVYGEGFDSDRHLVSLADVCEAMALLGSGDAPSALRVALSVIPSGPACAAFCMSVRGEAQVAAGDLTGARETAAALARYGPAAPYPAAASEWINGLAAKAAGDVQAASAAFGLAANGFAALPMPFEAAISRLDWAELVTAGIGAEVGPGQTAAQVTKDLEMFERLGARPAADRARHLLRRLGVQPVAAYRNRPSRQLSARETEVARLVAEGLTNPEIAERLFISQRTVTTHVQHIYQRLGVGSRSGLTRYVVEHLSPSRRNT